MASVRNVWLGDSHLMDHHHVPEQFYELLIPNGQGKHYHKLFGSTESGKRMNAEFKKLFYLLSKTYKGEATLFVIQVGSNNLRDDNDPNKTKEDIVNELLADYKELKEHILRQKSQALVVTSVIPDNKLELAPHYKKLNTELRKMFNNAENDVDCRLHFSDFVGKHLPEQENGAFYNKALFQDALHLNKKGAALFAKELVGKLPSISNRAYGRKPLSEKNRIRLQEYLKKKRGPPKANDAIYKTSRGPKFDLGHKLNLSRAQRNERPKNVRDRLFPKVDLRREQNRRLQEVRTEDRPRPYVGPGHRVVRVMRDENYGKREQERRERNRMHLEQRRKATRGILEPQRPRQEFFYQDRPKSPESYRYQEGDLIDLRDKLEQQPRQRRESDLIQFDD